MAFDLKIKLGNAAMQTPEDVAGALREVAEWLDGVGSYEADDEQILWHLDAGRIRDVNGNTVGDWEMTV